MRCTSEPVRQGQLLAQEDDREYGDQDDAQLGDRRDSCSIAELEGAEVAEPRGTRRKAGQEQEHPRPAGHLPGPGRPLDSARHDDDDEGLEIGIDALDADLGEDCG